MKTANVKTVNVKTVNVKTSLHVHFCAGIAAAQRYTSAELQRVIIIVLTYTVEYVTEHSGSMAILK